MELTIAQLHW